MVNKTVVSEHHKADFLAGLNEVVIHIANAIQAVGKDDWLTAHAEAEKVQLTAFDAKAIANRVVKELHA